MKKTANNLGKMVTKLFLPKYTHATDAAQPDPGKLFVATVFKSGTKLLEHIIEKLTGLNPYYLDMDVGSDYESAEPIVFEDGKFFIWHNIPSESVKARIREGKAKPIFLIRNVFDLAVSQYHHFANDVDAAINHSTCTSEYFASMSREEGISLILCGATSKQFHWTGFGYQLFHIQEILRYSKENPCHVVIYDRLVKNKRHEIDRLASFIGVHAQPQMVNELLDTSRLDAMREARIAAVGSGKHFRKGLPGDHVNVLAHQHYHMINHLMSTHAPLLPSLCIDRGTADIIDPGAANDIAAGKTIKRHSEETYI